MEAMELPAAPAPSGMDLPALLEQVVVREHQRLRQQLQSDWQREMHELSSIIQADTETKRVENRPSIGLGDSFFDFPDTLDNSSPGAVEPHAWLGRNVRSYAAATEIAAMDLSTWEDTEETSLFSGLLPDIIPKATGPLATTIMGRRPGPGGEADRGARRAVSCADDLRDKALGEKVAAAAAAAAAGGPERPARSKERTGTAPALKSSYSSERSVSSMTVPHKQAWADQHPGGAAAAGGAAAKAAAANPGAAADRPQDGVGGVGSPAATVSDPEQLQAEVMSEVSEVSACLSAMAGVESQAPGPSRNDGGPTAVLPVVHSLSMVPVAFLSRETTKMWLDKRSPAQLRMLMVVRSIYFDYLTVILIVANAFTIGMSTEYCAKNVVELPPMGLRIIEKIFAILFTAELMMRLFAFRLRFLTMPAWRWNILDSLVVSLQIVEEITATLELSGSQLPFAFTLMRMLRILRLVRVVRIVRLLRYISELRTIVVSISHSMKPLLSAIVLLALVVYITGIYFTQLTVHYRLDCGGSHCGTELEMYFGSVGVTVFHLFQAVTGGLEWNAMVSPLISQVSPFMGVVFALYIVFTSLALMNIVTGVFVETALQRGREDKDVYMINHLRELFCALDIDRNGQISWTELRENLTDPRLLSFFKEIDIDVSEAKGLFSLLDRDRSGTIDADEFLSGCLRLRGPAKALDLQLVMCEIAEQRRTTQKLVRHLRRARGPPRAGGGGAAGAGRGGVMSPQAHEVCPFVVTSPDSEPDVSAEVLHVTA